MSNKTLVEEFDALCPKLSRQLSRSSINGMRTAVRQLNKFLGRPSTRADLVESQVSAIVAHKVASGRLSTGIGSALRRLRRELKAASHVEVEAPPGDLLDYFLNVFWPNRAPTYKKPKVQRWLYSLAISLLVEVLGRPAQISDLTAQRAGEVLELARQRHTESVSIELEKTLWSLGRHAWQAGLFPDFQPRPRKQRAFQEGTLRHFYESEYRPARHATASRATLSDYGTLFRMLERFHRGELLLQELSNELVRKFIAWLLARELRAASVNKYRGMLLAIWRYAAEQGKLAQGPQIRKLPESRDAPDAWSESETTSILKAPRLMGWTHAIAGIPAAGWWTAILLVAYWTALRRSSLLKLRPRDVDLQSGWLNVPGALIKNRHGKRFRLGGDCIDALRAIWDPHRELLFPLDKVYDHWSLGEDFRAILEAAGVPPSTRLSNTQFHKIRRTVATLTAARRGLHAACDLLGHRSEEVTRRYVDPSKLPGNDATEFLPMLSD
jgi:integrase